MIELETKKVWSKTKIFRTALAAYAMLTVALWVCWFGCDTYFLQTGIKFDGSRVIPTNLHWYNVSFWLASIYMLLTAILVAGEVSYIVYRSFAYKTDRNKFIYEAVVHGIICVIILIFITLASYKLYNDAWIAEPKYDELSKLYDIKLNHNWYMLDMSILTLAAIFSSVTLFQANKAFKFHNIYFDFSLMVAILAVITIPVYIAAVCLIKVHPNIAYPGEFWLHIAGQGIYNSFLVLKAAMDVFLIAKLVLLIRLNNGQLQRSTKAIVIAAVLAAMNLIMSLLSRTITYSVEEIYKNINWIPEIILISISFIVGIIAGWNSCYRYIELYAKPLRRLDKEPMILN